MIKEVVFSEEFNRAFKRLKKRYHSLPDDIKKLLKSLVENPVQGKELYNGLRKIRLSITSKGKGKRGGGRVIIQVSINATRLAFIYIYDKSDIVNVSDAFLDQVIVEVGNGKFISMDLPQTEA